LRAAYGFYYWSGLQGWGEFDAARSSIDENSEGVCSPDIVDAKGSQFEIPVLRPCDAGTAEAREKSNADTSCALLAAMLNNPAGTQADWGAAINRTKGVVNRHLQRLKKVGPVAGKTPVEL
jgi:hypothetical protein